MNKQFSADDIVRILKPTWEEKECFHDDHEGGICIDCGELIPMKWEWEHDSGDMER